MIKVAYRKQHAHVFCNVYSRQTQNTTWALNGQLVFVIGFEWDEAYQSFDCGGFELEELST